MRETEPRIRVEDVYKVYGKAPQEAFRLMEQGITKEQILERTGLTVALAGVSLSIESEEIFTVMGLSGSGKSTLVRCLNGLVRPTRGRVLLDGEDLSTVDEATLRGIRRKRLGMVFQRFALFPHLTVLKNAEYGLEVQGVDPDVRRKKAYEVLELVGLQGWEDRKPHEMSGGMQQRVGLARALAVDPDILLMDEPFSALDPLIRREMQDELLDLQSRLRKTIVFITHDLREAIRIGDRIAMMKDGLLVQVGTPEEILTSPQDDYVAEFVESIDRSRVLTARDVMVKPKAVVFTRDGPRVALRRMDEEGLSSLFVVTKDRRLHGIVTADDALEAAQDGVESVSEIASTEYEVAGPDTPFDELAEMAAHATYPTPVLDEEGRLLGIAVRASVLSALVTARKGVRP